MATWYLADGHLWTPMHLTEGSWSGAFVFEMICCRVCFQLGHEQDLIRCADKRSAHFFFFLLTCTLGTLYYCTGVLHCGTRDKSSTL